MRLKMKFQSDTGKEFDDAVSAANDEHYERVRDIAADIIRRRWEHSQLQSKNVDELAGYLLAMEMFGFSEIVRYIENSRNVTNRDAAEFARNSEEEPDENSDFACIRSSENGKE